MPWIFYISYRKQDNETKKTLCSSLVHQLESGSCEGISQVHPVDTFCGYEGRSPTFDYSKGFWKYSVTVAQTGFKKRPQNSFYFQVQTLLKIFDQQTWIIAYEKSI